MMIDVVLIRHGSTAWNETRRMQGRADIALSAAGRLQVQSWNPPREYRHYTLYASPLKRAMETAQVLFARPPHTDPRLTEMDWGAWEGCTVDELRALHGDGMIQNERRGLDFRPQGGESPRDVAHRLGSWLKSLAAAGQPAVAVTHKGVIRAALSLATGWDMTDRPPVRFERSAAHLFSCDHAGALRLVQPNIAMTEQ